jgi:hypothetical protein
LVLYYIFSRVHMILEHCLSTQQKVIFEGE